MKENKPFADTVVVVVVVVAESPHGIHYLFLIKKSIFQLFSFEFKIDSLKKIVKSLIR